MGLYVWKTTLLVELWPSLSQLPANLKPALENYRMLPTISTHFQLDLWSLPSLQLLGDLSHSYLDMVRPSMCSYSCFEQCFSLLHQLYRELSPATTPPRAKPFLPGGPIIPHNSSQSNYPLSTHFCTSPLANNVVCAIYNRVLIKVLALWKTTLATLRK